MKKKSIKKLRGRSKKQSFIFIRYTILGLVIIALVGSGKIYSGLSKTHVLGASTGPVLLADHGGDDSSGGSSGGSPGDSGSGGSGGSSGQGGSSGSGSNTSGSGTGSSPAGREIQQSNVSGSIQVDCVGPDGKHFTTTFHDCQELNQKWGHDNFNFTPLGNQIQTNEQEQQPEPSQSPLPHTSTRKMEAQVEGNKGELNLQTTGLHIEMKREDDGTLKITAKKEDGQEVELQQDSLDTVNEALKDQEIEVGTNSANELELTSKNVTAHTEFPLSIDPSTNTLSITTPAGTKAVTVLPDKAVENLLESHILSSVLSQSSTNITGSGSATTSIGLTTQNNEPVFEIQGIKEKHLLGIFPVAFPKTVTVSAQTGLITQTQESFFNSILESLSI